MCGIAGILSPDPGRINRALLKKMGDTLAHRGPDGEGVYEFHGQHLHMGFAHRRLSILDLTEAASQPMRYMNRYVIVHNGEIYNYREIRSALQREGYAFLSQSDTEVIAAAYHQYGEDCLHHFDGMFAFAVWDEETEQLFCARDRFGEKPFFYHFDHSTRTLLFASEMKALWAAGLQRKVNDKMLLHFISAGQTTIPAFPDISFFENIFRLNPGHYILYKAGQEHITYNSWWDLDTATMIGISEKEAIDRFRALFETSVRRRLRSDVPAGTSLSGGLDSSSIASLCNSVTDEGYSHHAFSAVFPGFSRDESGYIRSLSGHFGLRLHETMPTETGLAAEIKKLMDFQEEPFSSASVYAQYKVFQLAAEQKIKVLLDGQGADEILGGYTRYTHWYLQELVGRNRFKEAAGQAELFRANEFLPGWNWLNYLAAKLPSLTASQLEKRVKRKQLKNADIDHRYLSDNLVGGFIYKPVVEKLNDILYFDTRQGPLQELLRYADRNSMAHGTEVRLPFLYHELVEFVFSLPSSFRMNNGFTKWILRKSMEKELPEHIVWRKGKTGFEPPQQNWMLNAEVQRNIRESMAKLVDLKILNASVLKREIHAHSAFSENNQDWRYWMAGLMFE